MLEELFREYEKLTKNIISGVKIDVSVDEFFEKREVIIKEISSLDISGEERKKAYIRLGLDVLDKELGLVIKEELEKTKEDIRKNGNNKKIYSGYVSKNTVGNYFRRTI